MNSEAVAHVGRAPGPAFPRDAPRLDAVGDEISDWSTTRCYGSVRTNFITGMFRQSSLPFRAALLAACLAVPAWSVAAIDRGAALAAGQAVLDKHCVKCHGPLEQKEGLELDTVEAALKGSREGPVLVPGHPEKSKLVDALAAAADPHMPPKKQLSDGEIDALRAWVVALGQAAAEAPAATATAARPALTGPLPDEPTAAIDFAVAAGWTQRGVTPAPRCDDLTFLRRIYLDLAGRIPTPAEVSAFQAEAASDKRTRLVDQLLASEDYPRTFRETWDTLLMGRHTGRREQRRRDNGWFAYLEDVFRKNRPWNDVVAELITARPSTPETRGALWFLYERKNEYQQLAEAIAPVIYGTKVDCAQCHDHPLSREIKQAHYWALVAAFNRSKNVEGGTPAVGESAIGGFINFTNLKKESQPAVVSLLNGRVIPETRPAADVKETDAPEGYVDGAAAVKVPKFSRRGELAKAATEGNPLLARSFVNHTWAILLGRGLVHPVDEMNSKHPPSHPELLDWLAADFAAHHYDIRRLIRAVVLSRVYQLAPPRGADRPVPEAFAAAAEKPLRAEILARAAGIASGRTEEDPRLRQAMIEAFPDVLPRVTRATIQQAMLLANNDLLAGLFRPGTNAVPLAVPAERRVQDAFQRALIRAPDAEELAQGVAFLNRRPTEPEAAYGQLLWALVAGPEFLINR